MATTSGTELLAQAAAAMAAADRTRSTLDFHQTHPHGDREYLAQRQAAAVARLDGAVAGRDADTDAALLELAAAWFGEFDAATDLYNELAAVYAARGVVLELDAMTATPAG